MANKKINGTVQFYRQGEFGLIKGEDGKEYCFGRKAISCRTKLYYGDLVSFTVDQNHPILAEHVNCDVTQTGVRKALSKKGYTLKSESRNLFSVIVRHSNDKVFIKEHMTLSQIVEWVKFAKKVTKEDIDKMFEKSNEKNDMKNDDCKIGGHVVPDDMAKNFGVPDDGTDTPVKKSLEEAAGEADIKVDTEVIHVHRQFA